MTGNGFIPAPLAYLSSFPDDPEVSPTNSAEISLTLGLSPTESFKEICPNELSRPSALSA